MRRGAGFAAAEDAVQESLIEAPRGWDARPPRDPKAWLVTGDARTVARVLYLIFNEGYSGDVDLAARINAETRV